MPETEDRATIHKLLVDIADGTQSFRVPYVARLVHVGLDPKAPDHVAVWYRLSIGRPGTVTYEQTWSLAVVGTGHAFPASAVVLGTAPTPSGLVWHLLDLDGNVERQDRAR